jgi:hypothetical protein
MSAEIVALCDIDLGRLEKFDGCNKYENYIEMLEKERLDVVHICTPHYLHADMIIEALERGVNVLCENSTAANLGAIYWANSGEDMREFVEYVNHPNFHACWDTGHANCEGSQYDDIMALGEELYAIHYHDNMGADTHEMPYCGTMDNDEVMRALVDVGYSGYFTFEADGEKRAQRRWNGPGDECPIFEDLYPDRAPILAVGQFTRLEQEILLYQIGEYLLSQYGLLAK